MTLVLRKSPPKLNKPQLFLRPTPAARWPLEWARALGRCDGDGNVIDRSLDELLHSARERRLYQCEELRKSGRTRDLCCAAALATDEIVRHEVLIDLGYGVVRRSMRGYQLIHLVLALALASRFLFDDKQALGVVSVTTATALVSQQALRSLGAVELTATQAASLHQALGAYLANCERNAHALGLNGAHLWLFSRRAVSDLLNLAWRAGSPGGMSWGKWTLFVEGELADPGARKALYKMASGEASLPIAIFAD